MPLVQDTSIWLGFMMSARGSMVLATNGVGMTCDDKLHALSVSRYVHPQSIVQ
jgi:hypothetical protein